MNQYQDSFSFNKKIYIIECQMSYDVGVFIFMVLLTLYQQSWQFSLVSLFFTMQIIYLFIFHNMYAIKQMQLLWATNMVIILIVLLLA